MLFKLAGVLAATAVLAGCVAAPETATRPHPSIWPCSTIHEELQRQETANKQARQTRSSLSWFPIVGTAALAIQPDLTRAGHLRTRANECKQRAGL